MKTNDLNTEELQELEENIRKKTEVICPKCKGSSYINKSVKTDNPNLMLFYILLGASFTIFFFINALFYIRRKIKKRNLPKEITESINKEDSNSLLGLHLPTKTIINCRDCNYVYYQSYDSGDIVVVLVSFITLILVIFTILMIYTR